MRFFPPSSMECIPQKRCRIYEREVQAANSELQALPAPSIEAVSINDTLPDRLEDFAAAFAGKEREVEAFLVARKQLTTGQPWTDAAEYLESRVAGKIPAFLEAVTQWAQQNKEAEAKAA